MLARVSVKQACVRLILILLGACLPGALFAAQNGTPQVLGRITVNGGKHFSASQIIAASGLVEGRPVEKTDLDAAAARLGSTGAFSGVAYRYRIAEGDMEVTFHVEEVSSYRPCVFDNFIGLSDTQIIAAAQKEVPLFDGLLPETGALPDEVSAALNRWIQANGFPGTVSWIRSGKLDSPNWKYVFRIHGNEPTVAEVHVTGGPLDQTLLRDATSHLLGHLYSRTDASAVAHSGLTDVYRNHGYLRADFADPEAAFLEPQPGQLDRAHVSVTLPVNPGPQFHWHGASWTGNRVFPARELSALMGLEEGDAASAQRIADGWEAIRQLYGSKGYIMTQLRTEEHLDDSARLVTYQVDVNEGEQYRMGELKVVGVDARTENRVRAAWHLPKGAIFDALYQKKFLRRDLTAAFGDNVLQVRQISISRVPDTQTLLVEVRISFE